MPDAVLSIGSNSGDRVGHLRSALAELAAWVTAVSPVYETPPWGPVEQDDFLNAVVLVSDDGADGAEWLRRAHRAENAAGRTREVRWGPRTLDVDVVAVDGEQSDDPGLTLPHPRAAERAFVLVPWADVDPGATLGGVPVADLARRLPDADDVRRRDDLSIVSR
ncbi:2-amino-4-hydroxy-6-hydroxymethyldihydropteridine diphosphokinase [Jatrophihabitans endophyticus]|uniref:2-amino-4-hydroxy-6- hydroxymethyldihydropteridine diphosphokinase n=1 Tax=Jatrophihabitans endophyticus TaxID=1206085 RepID=UPI001A037E8E|nr:2-amino-4-hydroxy-6-hydroxymethyldihydropteridine diphosphokinase [Jatrophihabitans endophyticus]MBE7187050.1 2-amino-4-hydroxy-6-hydroxymethyldihydropteridine diphosphokinase [Jatrophihabitans endophyticus]